MEDSEISEIFYHENFRTPVPTALILRRTAPRGSYLIEEKGCDYGIGQVFGMARNLVSDHVRHAHSIGNNENT